MILYFISFTRYFYRFLVDFSRDFLLLGVEFFCAFVSISKFTRGPELTYPEL